MRAIIMINKAGGGPGKMLTQRGAAGINMHGAVLFNSLNLGETVTIGNFHTRNFAKKGEKDTTNYTDQVGWACPTLCTGWPKLIGRLIGPRQLAIGHLGSPSWPIIWKYIVLRPTKRNLATVSLFNHFPDTIAENTRSGKSAAGRGSGGNFDFDNQL